ncbi:Uncharacterized protein SCF082_LOCUS44322, partial [Durusdinium trenchii]
PRPAFEAQEVPSEHSSPWPGEASSENAILPLPGDAFSFAEQVTTPELEEGGPSYCTGEEEEEEVEVEVEELVEEYVEDAEEDPEEDGLEEDAEAEEEEAEEERLQTDVDLEDLEDEDEATLDELADDSDSDQPGTTLEDGGQCDEAVEEVLPRRVTPVIDEALLMSAAAPVKAKKKKKKRKKKRRASKRKLLDEEPAVEKKPPVPRFPHPIGPKVKEAAPPAPVAVTERVPLRERFARHLLLGRFPKRKILADAQDSANEADNEAEEEKPKDDPGEDEPSSEDQAQRLGHLLCSVCPNGHENGWFAPN